MKLTTQQEATLRKRPQYTALWLSVLQPNTLFTALVTGSYSTGETEINYYSLSGDINTAYPDCLALISYANSPTDREALRVRSVTGSVITFAENSLNWRNDMILQVVDYINPDAKFPKIIQDPNNDDNVIFYKDGDIPYSNQNTIYGTFVNMGSHRAAFIETGSVSLYYTATGTYNVRDDSITYDWHFEGGTPTGSTALTPGNVSYNSTGNHKTTLTVTSASGAVDKSYRYVSIYDRPENGTDVPVLKWTLNDFSGSRGEGGYRASIRTWQNLDTIVENALVVLFADDRYGDENVSLGGNGQNNSKIVFVGYILKDTIEFNYRDGWAEFEVGSITEVMKEAEGFSVSCQSKSTASTWFELQEMTVQKAIYHYLKWHSTILGVADFQYVDDDRLFEYFDTDRASLYDSIYSFVSEGLYGEVVSDRQGKIWAEIEPIGLTDPVTDIPTTTAIQKHDWVGSPNISNRKTAEVSFVEMGGIAYEGADSDGFQALLTNAPSKTPLYRGKSDSPRQGLILNGQSQLNKIAGNYLASKRAKVEDVTLTLAGNYRNYDIAPQEKLYLLVDESDTVTEQSLIPLPFNIESMDWQYDPSAESFYPEVTFAPITTGTAGETVIIPPIPPDGGYAYPPLELPPFPSFPSTPPVQQGSIEIAGFSASAGFFYTTDFDASHPTWLLWNFGIDPTDQANVTNGSENFTFFRTPNGAYWFGASQAGKRGDYSLYRAPFIGGQWEKIIDTDFLAIPYSPNNGYIRATGFDPTQPERVAFVTTYSTFGAVTHNMWIADSFVDQSSFVKKATFGITNDQEGNLTWGGDEWVMDAITSTTNQFVTFDNNGTALNVSDNTGQASEAFFHTRAGQSKTILKRIGLTSVLARSEDSGRTQTNISTPLVLDSCTTSPDGVFMMGRYDSTAERGRSSDGGYSWSTMPGLVPGGSYCFEYAGGEGTKSRWVAARGAIYYSANFGNSWVDKTGNLLDIFPPPSGANIAKMVATLITGD